MGCGRKLAAFSGLCLAETGDFEQAVQVQSGAIRRLEEARAPNALIAVFADHLEVFEASRPIRDPQPAP